MKWQWDGTCQEESAMSLFKLFLNVKTTVSVFGRLNFLVGSGDGEKPWTASLTTSDSVVFSYWTLKNHFVILEQWITTLLIQYFNSKYIWWWELLH